MLLEASHEIDLALWMLGPGRCIGAVAQNGGETWSLLVRHDCGAASSVVLDGTYEGYRRRAEVCGPAGVISHEWASEDWRWSLAGPGIPWSMEGDDPRGGWTTPAATYESAMRAFLGDGGGASLVEGMNVLRVCDDARMFDGLQ
jgi:predicted dehydrogenase